MPIKCPVAPLEFCFLADWYFRERGVRDEVEMTYVTPLDAAFTKPVAAEHLGGMLAREGHRARRPSSPPARSTATAAGSISCDEREVPFDLLVAVPLHGGAAYVEPLAGPGRRARLRLDRPAHAAVARRRRTSSRSATPTNLPTSKAGSVTHFEGEVLVENVRRFLAGEPLDGSFDGHANCFIETGFHKALLIDFNYETEPLPGRFPTALGPLPLLKESRLNHLGKLAFQWHLLARAAARARHPRHRARDAARPASSAVPAAPRRRSER